ncbi:unnamed protein product [Ceutorhynchus assimilis]|uniref:Uncharacterized protein n=1 Tax=Ceutorhynchus assimilis TaxID=467358 RepID=A0A9N9N227_9CUCU|nr:unnamed protein product [Ceutorhynchus assimilis]
MVAHHLIWCSVVNKDRKAALATNSPVAHRTGLVRLIEGTVIDGRYAQIIESTSSFILPSISPSAVANEIVPTATKVLGDGAGASIIAPTPVVLEGSLTDSAGSEETSTESSDEDNEEDRNGRNKSGLNFQSKKRTLTPAIRSFVSRQRPSFALKRNKAGATAAATITRLYFTPTVTAIPVSKANRLGGRRSSSSNQVTQPTASGSRRFPGLKLRLQVDEAALAKLMLHLVYLDELELREVLHWATAITEGLVRCLVEIRDLESDLRLQQV